LALSLARVPYAWAACPRTNNCFALSPIKAEPKAATLRMIIMSANRYIPIVTPIAMCIPQMQISQIFRVLSFQIKNEYPISKRQTNIPATGNRYFHLTRISGSIMLKGGRMRERHILEPSHHTLQRHFVKQLK